MGWFSILSIGLFLALIGRSMLKMWQNPHNKGRQVLLMLIFSVHIAVIVYLGLD